MTENLAGRGEGLAGLAKRWRAEIEKCCPVLLKDANSNFADASCRQQMRDVEELEAEIAALEAAAPAGTARETAMVNYIRGIVDHDHNLYCRKDGSACVATCVNGRAALATLSPQAPVDILAELDHEKYTGPAGKIMQAREPAGSGASEPGVGYSEDSAFSVNHAAIRKMQRDRASSGTHGWTGTCCENGNMGQPHICCKSPGNLPPNVVDLRTRMFELDRLLLDPHPGLTTWVAAYGNAAKHLLQFFDEANAIPDAPGSPRKVGEDAQAEKYERTHSRVWVNAWNEALEEVCGLVAVNGCSLDFGPFSIGHNPKRVQQEHTMIVELIRALKHPVPALRSSSVPVGEQP